MSENKKVYTVDEIKALVTTRADWAEKAITRLYQEQTPSEQDAETTVYHNGKGFSAVDAEILTSFAKQIIRMGESVRRDNGRRLSDKQLAIAFKRLGKYAGQLHRLAYSEGTAAKAPALQSVATAA